MNTAAGLFWRRDDGPEINAEYDRFSHYNVSGGVANDSIYDESSLLLPHNIGFNVPQWAEHAENEPRLFENVTSLKGFRMRLRAMLAMDAHVVARLLDFENALRLYSHFPHDPQAVSLALTTKTNFIAQVKKILALDLEEHFGEQALTGVLHDYRKGDVFDAPSAFQPTPAEWKLDPTTETLCEATRQGAWILHHYLGRKVKYSDKGYEGDYCSDLDRTSDMACVRYIQDFFRGRIATVTDLGYESGGVPQIIPADGNPEEIRARGIVPVFIIAEESSPELNLDAMEPGDEVIFIDGLDGTQLAREMIPGGASVMLARGIVSLDESGKKYVKITTSSILFPEGKGLGNEPVWYFADDRIGAFRQVGGQPIERIEVDNNTTSFEDTELILNLYGDPKLQTAPLTSLLEKLESGDSSLSLPRKFSRGMASSEHGLKVALPEGPDLAASDQNPAKTKVGHWDHAARHYTETAGGASRTASGKRVRVPCEEPMYYGKKLEHVEALRNLSK